VIIAIDAGHGWPDRGAVANGLVEHSANLALARRVCELLRDSGHNATLTRDTGRLVSWATRRKRAEGADLVCSIHHNAAPDPSIGGAQAYLLPGPSDRLTGAAWRILDGLPAGLRPGKVFQTHPTDWRKRAHRVLSSFGSPSLLLEVGYLTSAVDAANLHRYYRHIDTLARPIAEALAAY